MRCARVSAHGYTPRGAKTRPQQPWCAAPPPYPQRNVTHDMHGAARDNSTTQLPLPQPQHKAHTSDKSQNPTHRGGNTHAAPIKHRHHMHMHCGPIPTRKRVAVAHQSLTVRSAHLPRRDRFTGVPTRRSLGAHTPECSDWTRPAPWVSWLRDDAHDIWRPRPLSWTRSAPQCAGAYSSGGGWG